MSAFNAALGLLQLKYISQALARRKEIDAAYRQRLNGVEIIHCLNDAGEKVANYAYFLILAQADHPIRRDDLYKKLKDIGIHVRRYFYPLISEFPMYQDLPSAHKDNLPVATAATQQVLCLPIYSELEIRVADETTCFITGQ